MQNVLTRNQMIASAAGTLEALEILGNAGGRLSLRELVTAMRRPKATVHRMLSTLVHTGFVEQDDEGRYLLTLKAWRIGAAAVRKLDLVERARPILEKLAAETGETVHLAVLDPSGGVVYVAKVESAQSIGVQTRLGQLNPSWCTATGRSLLAFNDSVAARVLAGPLARRTRKTITDPRTLRGRLAEARERGYAVTIAENHPEMGGVAAPVRDHSGAAVAACGVAIPEYRMNENVIARAIPCVLRAAAALSAELGHAQDESRRSPRAA
ncbi:MAG TPA: IclR family transcriptional regulator [Casimicrobiaceae bacterium]|jgi:DNA-binding IclR family transcriptional regulator|nr:IclR family transcriptional regulator [Casimicrobiaceae bacterium]